MCVPAASQAVLVDAAWATGDFGGGDDDNGSSVDMFVNWMRVGWFGVDWIGFCFYEWKIWSFDFCCWTFGYFIGVVKLSRVLFL